MWCVSPGLQYISCVAHLQSHTQCWRPLQTRQAGTLLAPCGPELRALGSNFSTQTGTEEVTQDLQHRPRPVGDTETNTVQVRTEMRIHREGWDNSLPTLSLPS